MTRLVALFAVAAALAAGAARADVFAPVPTAVGAGGTVVLPSAEVPNPGGSLLLPPGWTRTASTPASLDYPTLLQLWQQAGAAYGIPWQVLAAINKIESNFGRNMGPSSAGAVGWMQFMPDTWLRWGLDASGDRIADPWNPQDGVYAAARYLAAAGGRTDIARAIFAYNHADWYVEDVLSLAQLFRDGGGAAFTLDRMGQDASQAQLDVEHAKSDLARAIQAQRRLARIAARLQARADRVTGLSDRLEAQKRATLAGVRSDEAAKRVGELRDRLDSAHEALDAARSAPFLAGSGLAGGPAFQDGYVFPVGGGPSVVSVSAHHHDYPAADIAAPAGSPLYALTNGVVEGAWRDANSRCGIGFTIRGADGLAWTYCHLSYLESSVQVGAVLTAGAPVGLVGSTGHAIGPHLHLQLAPPTAYPQRQQWFQAFAGRGFRWQGEPAPPATGAATEDVFASGPRTPASSQVIAFTR